MIRGYLTVFLAMTLSLLTGFVLLLTGAAVRNGEKVRFESAADISMNAVLSEYHVGLLEKYDLLYIDTSYLGKEPSLENLKERLSYYLEENIDPPWGELKVKEVGITAIETAAAGQGGSMRNQAVSYMLHYGEPAKRQWKVLDYMDEIRFLETLNPMEQWHMLMEQLAGMELPKLQNQEGIWEEIPLLNPADSAYGFAGSDIFYLTQVDLGVAGVVSAPISDCISHRDIQNSESTDREYLQDEGAFLAYLYEKFGYLKNPYQQSVLSCQLEYAACGKSSDMENVREVGERLFRWRFADNLSCALADISLRAQAEAAADLLQVVRLNAAFKEPVIQSILYACAFLESVSDMRILYSGGEVPVRKSSHTMSVEHVLSGTLYRGNSTGGLSYKEYLAGMLLLLETETLNLRVMDIIEMEMRIYDGNPYFAMDWCVERYLAKISVVNNFGDVWVINRKYGYG